ncbi:MAG: hypothetical protein Q9195_002492 [Heterodermia aff. obscurata]
MAHESDSRAITSSPLHANAAVPAPSIDQPTAEATPTPPVTHPDNGSSFTDSVQKYTNILLDFISNASNESLGACVVGLGASTYFVLGRIGLVLIGIVGGIVLHATWEYNGQHHGEEDDEAKALELKRRREVGLDVVRRLLDWRESRSRNDEVEQKRLQTTALSSSKPQLDYSNFAPATSAALEALTDAVIRDYIKYEWISPKIWSQTLMFIDGGITLTGFFLAFSSHLSRKRPEDTLIDFLTNSSSIIVVFMNELSSALMAPGVYNTECSNAIYRYLEHNPDSHLANVMDVEQQQRKLKAVAEDILHSFLDPPAYKCEPVKAFLREVLAGLVLEMTVQSCSKAEFINGWIIYLLEEGDTELIDVIDAGVSGVTGKANTKSSTVSTSSAELVGSNETQDIATSSPRATTEHKRTVSRAEEAMEEAMQEAKRLTELIAAEEAKRNQEIVPQRASKSQELLDTESSSATTPNGPTPSSSASDLAASTHFEDDAVIHSSPTAETPAVASFTSFDQILPPQQTTALQDVQLPSTPAIPPLTLYNATVSLFDDAQPGEKATMRSKPQADYMIQIEPATPQHPGWMIARKYPDFETLHEVLRRISVVSGVPAFAQKHSALPGWKNRTKETLRTDLERYLRDALSFSRLAESEGMKRFLEKDHGPASGANKGGFGFPSPAAFESMGKGMLDVLASAPKGAAGGGKAILGGFTGVVGGLGSIGQKKHASISPNRPYNGSVSRSSLNLPRTESFESPSREAAAVRQSRDDVRDSFRASSDSVEKPPLPSRASELSSQETSDTTVDSVSDGPVNHASTGRSSLDPFVELSENGNKQPELHLPPPPSEITDDYNTPGGSPLLPNPNQNASNTDPGPTTTMLAEPSAASPAISSTPRTEFQRLASQPLTEPETRVAVELFFALINELYTLSSAWNIRRTLLNAAKSYLLRPGNPSLISIQQLLQSYLDSNIADDGIAAHLTKLRENALPTEVELKNWPKPLDEGEKKKLRSKARKLLVEKGMPAALTSVMGAAASGEALGRVFDSLQVESVAKGFMFAIILQAIRALAQ